VRRQSDSRALLVEGCKSAWFLRGNGYDAAMVVALLFAAALCGNPVMAPDGGAAKSSWKANLAAAKFPTHLVEVTPRSNFAIVYGCDDAPFTLKLDGAHLAVAYFQGAGRFEVVDFQPGTAPGTFVLTVRPDGAQKGEPFLVQVRLLNPALGIWNLWGDDNRMFTGRKTFIDEAQSKQVKTVRPPAGDCSTTRGSE
jgi:hypothetical protein